MEKRSLIKNGSRFLNATPHSSSRSQRRGFFFLRAPFYVTFDALVPESYRALRSKSIQPREKKVYRAKRQKLLSAVSDATTSVHATNGVNSPRGHIVRALVIEQHAGHA